jgi:hypothetical protein
MEKQIITDGECKKFLMEAFKCSRMQVWKALHYESESDMARRIRALALKRGGALVGGFAPECETTYEEAVQTMTQRWGERVKIVLFRNTGEVKVYVDGDISRTVVSPSLPEFIRLQREVELMARAL